MSINNLYKAQGDVFAFDGDFICDFLNNKRNNN